MGKIQVTDEFLYQHMPKLEEKILNEMPEEQEINVEFTEQFQDKMKVLLRKAKQKEKYGIPIARWRRAVAMLIIILVGTMTLSFSVEAVREKIFNVVRTVYETYIENRYFVEEDKISKFKPVYPQYIPEGYNLIIEDSDETFLVLSYENLDGSVLFMKQEQITDGLLISEDNEYVSKKSVIVLGNKATMYKKENGTIRVRWSSGNCEYMVSAENLNEKEMLKICNSLK